MKNELLHLHPMCILMAEDVQEPALRVRPDRKARRARKKACRREADARFLRMLAGK